MEYKLNTTLPIQFEKIENPPYLNDSRFQAVKCYVAHEKENFNGSYFDVSVLEKMGKNMAGVPIVGYISKNNLNEADYNGHEERLIIDNNGISTEYLGRAYGCVISNDDVSIVDRLHGDGTMRKYLCVTGILWKMFTEAIDIFDRDVLKPQSMELQEDSISGKFEKDNLFHFTDAKIRALCILNTNVNPAMSNSIIEKFSKSNVENNIQELLKEVNDSIKEFSLKNEDLKINDINLKNEQFERGEIENMENENQVSEVIEEVIEENIIENQETPEKVEEIALEVVVEENVNEVEVETIQEEVIELIETEFDILKKENESLKLKVSEYESQISTITEEKSTLENQVSEFTTLIEQKDSTINVLEKYKTDTEFAKKKDIVADMIEEFELALKDNTEFETIKKNAIDMEVEDLRKELFALEGMLKHKANTNKTKKTNFSLVSVDINTKEDDLNIYGEASKYFKKQ